MLETFADPQPSRDSDATSVKKSFRFKPLLAKLNTATWAVWCPVAAIMSVNAFIHSSTDCWSVVSETSWLWLPPVLELFHKATHVFHETGNVIKLVMKLTIAQLRAVEGHRTMPTYWL